MRADSMLTLAENDLSDMRDVFEMGTYVVVIIVSALIMILWLKRRGRSKKK
ncbi:hypothetical protein ACFQMJ_12650 [Cohnella cellulosilytica]|uniref:LPXTG cell wall anchor domain-containing protein n=1 Tax=Cohnella cellulosilytica TaxID=986710 RepID=A0ABW2FB74_9BACL